MKFLLLFAHLIVPLQHREEGTELPFPIIYRIETNLKRNDR